MKKRIATAILILVALLFANAYAEDATVYDDTKNALITEIDNVLGSEFNSKLIYDELISGDFGKAFLLIAEYVKSRVAITLFNRNNIMSTIFAILSVAVFVSLAESADTAKNCSALLCVSLSAVLIKLYYSLFCFARQALTSVFSLMRVALPLFMGINAAGGKGAAATADGMFIGFTVIFGHLCSLLLPSVTIAAAAAIISTFGFSFDKIIKFIFALINWCLGIFGVLFTALLKLTSVGAANFDFVAMSGVKFAISHGIPVIGGFVSDSANALMSAAVVIRNSLGLLTALVIGIICAAPCIHIFAVFLVLKFLSSVCSAFSENACCKLADCFSSCICELAIILLAVCVVFVIGSAIMLSSFGV